VAADVSERKVINLNPTQVGARKILKLLFIFLAKTNIQYYKGKLE